MRSIGPNNARLWVGVCAVYSIRIVLCVCMQAGFCEMRRVPSFGLFEDASELSFLGQRISLNVMATACKDDTQPRVQISLGNMGAKRERKKRLADQRK